MKGERRKKKSKSRRNVDNPLPECKISCIIKIQEYFPPLHFVFIEIAKKILQGPSRWVRRLKFGLAGVCTDVSEQEKLIKHCWRDR